MDKKNQWEPNIIVFACNWCSYAGADLAGVSRLQYPPNVKINRIMCTGRMNPSILLNTFLLGADGILLCGCHFGDCHYISGNDKADVMTKKAKKLLNMVGIGEERYEFEQISAAEGPKFANTMTSFTQRIKDLGPNPLVKTQDMKTKKQKDFNEILKESRAYHCYQCSQCTGGCPISRKRNEYNPRKEMRRLLVGQEEKVMNNLELWSCLTCGLCNSRCPHDVNLVGFVKEMRVKANKENKIGKPSHDGIMQKLIHVQINSNNQKRISWIDSGIKTAKKSEYLYFAGCLPYLDVVFSENGSKSLQIAKDTLSILNKFGIEPIVLDNEKCCGHDALYSGDDLTFEKLAKHNIKLIKESGAKKVVFSCPECYYAFSNEYVKEFGELSFEAVHITQIITEKLKSNGFRMEAIKKKITYQDPCRLGRFSNIFEEPREIFSLIPGLKFVEMDKNKLDSLCCSSTGWTNCFNCSKRLQVERLNDAKSTEANSLITACPKCQIHLSCAQEKEEGKIDIKDITSLVVEAIR
ncbi:MAG: hydrogenase iron-sulfur subunit [bacterium]|nr:hydrogenase iron-sulfur subunit [bacterium]